MSYQHQISLHTKGHGDMHDITGQVAAAVNSSGVTTGIVNVFNVGSTAAIGAIEFEPGLQHDMPAILDKLIPPSRSYGHEQTWHDGNGHSHLQATLARFLPDRSHRRRKAGPRHLAADLSPRMRRPQPRTCRINHGGWRVATLKRELTRMNAFWLPPRDSNPDMLIQSQLSCR